MSRAKLYPYDGREITLVEISHLCYPVRNLNTIRTQLGRGMTVDEIIKTDVIKSAFYGRKKGQATQRENKKNVG